MKNVCRAELDTYYARLYGPTRNELRYILDPFAWRLPVGQRCGT